MENNIIAQTRYFTDRELELFSELIEKLIKTRNRVSNEAYRAEAHDIASKLLRAIYARKKSNVSFKDHNSE